MTLQKTILRIMTATIPLMLLGFVLAPSSGWAQGACCLGGGGCVMVDGRQTCMGMGGVYQDDGSSCADGSAPCELGAEFALQCIGFDDLGGGLWRYRYRLDNLSEPEDGTPDGEKRRGRFLKVLLKAMKIAGALAACVATGGNKVVCALTMVAGIALDPAGETTDRVIKLEFEGEGIPPGGYSEFEFVIDQPPGLIEYELAGEPQSRARGFIVGPLPGAVGAQNRSWGSLKGLYGF